MYSGNENNTLYSVFAAACGSGIQSINYDIRSTPPRSSDRAKTGNQAWHEIVCGAANCDVEEEEEEEAGEEEDEGASEAIGATKTAR